MKLALNNVVPAVVLFAGLASALTTPQSSAVKQRRGPVQPRRTSSLLISNFSHSISILAINLYLGPAAQPELPTVQEATAAASAANLNLTDIQGDVL